MIRRTRLASLFSTAAPRAELLEARRLFDASAGDVAFGAGAASTTATLSDGDGTAVTLTLAGPGSGTVAQDDDGRLRVALRDTTGTSSIMIKTDAGGDGLAALAGVDVTGSLRALTAKTADLHGDLTASGPVRTVWLNTAADGGTITSAASLGEVRTAGDLGADVRVPAGRVGSINVGGSASSLVVRAARVDRVDVQGDLSDSKVLLLPPADQRGPSGLGRMTVRGAIRASLVHSMADVGTVSAGAMFGSAVVAGIRFEERTSGSDIFDPILPTERNEDPYIDFTGSYSIGAVTVSGAARDAGQFSFGDSRIAAYRVGNVKLAGVQPENGGRQFGVAGYYVRRVQRRFGGPGGDTVSVKQPTQAGWFSVEQIYEPLVYNAATGTYSGSGAVTISGADFYSDIPFQNVLELPADGVEVGTVANHPTAATVRFTVGGTFEARDAQANVVAQHATLAGLALALVGTPGTSMKIVQENRAVTSYLAAVSSVPATLTFLSTSLSPELTVRLEDPSIVFRNPSGTQYRLPTPEEARAGTEALGVAARLYYRPVLKLRDGDAPMLVGRRFDVEYGARDVTLTPALALEVTGEAGPFPDAKTALLGDGPRSGSARFPMRVRGMTASGLADGGTAVLYVAGRTVINAAGATLDLPDADRLR